MTRTFIRLSLFCLGGTTIAWLVSGNASPLLASVLALAILWTIFVRMHGSGK